MTNKTVLVLDDDAQIVEALALVLNAAGYQVIQETDSTGFESLVEQTQPDILIIDIRLGPDDGREITSKLKLNPKTKNIPVILISARVGTVEGLDLSGASLYLAKPFRMQELLDAIQGLLPPSA